MRKKQKHVLLSGAIELFKLLKPGSAPIDIELIKQQPETHSSNGFVPSRIVHQEIGRVICTYTSISPRQKAAAYAQLGELNRQASKLSKSRTPLLKNDSTNDRAIVGPKSDLKTNPNEPIVSGSRETTKKGNTKCFCLKAPPLHNPTDCESVQIHKDERENEGKWYKQWNSEL